MISEKPSIRIEEVTSFSEHDADAIRTLAKTIGKNYKPLSDDDIKGIVATPMTKLIVARERHQQKIIGMITLVIYRIPYVRKAYLDDLVVAERFRGMGIGSTLLNKAILLAKNAGASYVDFTSRPRRDNSNKLYKKLGFEKRETNVYRLALDYAEV